jgi:copper chaperone CopZ
MCCSKCKEKVVEEILEVDGVFDVRVDSYYDSKVVVVVKPTGLNKEELLRKVRKVSKKARFVKLDAKENAKQEERKNKDGKNKGGGKNDDEKKGSGRKREKETTVYHADPRPMPGKPIWDLVSDPDFPLDSSPVYATRSLPKKGSCCTIL